MTALSDWLDACDYIGPAKNLRTYRAMGGSGGTPGSDRPRLIVIHTMEASEAPGRARSTAQWVKDSGGAAQVSCHFTADDVEAIRCVADIHTAFTQLTPWNDMSLSIEQAGFAAQTLGDWMDPYSVGQRRIVARIVAAWCEKWAIPPVFLDAGDLVDWRNCTGITTHYQISLASQRPELTSLGYKAGNHTDPGPNYPMDMLIAEVKTLLGGSTTEEPMIDYLGILPDGSVFARGGGTARRVNGEEIAGVYAGLKVHQVPAGSNWEAWVAKELAAYDRAVA